MGPGQELALRRYVDPRLTETYHGNECGPELFCSPNPSGEGSALGTYPDLRRYSKT